MNDQTLRLPSPAKLNLFLHVLQRRPDGYHDLQTVFQLIDFADTLTFRALESGECQYIGPKIDNNIILRAVDLLREVTGCSLGVEISLNKKIPMGGGLGGGSSNAATTLIGLNHLWQTGLGLTELKLLGGKLGADVPIFIHGHSAWAEGTGEKLTSLTLPERWFLIIFPGINTNTAKIFQHPQLTRRQTGLTIADFDYRHSTNDCENIARSIHPEIDRAMTWLEEQFSVRMTGTGSCVFVAFENEAEARSLAASVPQPMISFIAKGMNISSLHTTLHLQPISTGASPSGKAQGFDPCIPRFESLRPSHFELS